MESEPKQFELLRRFQDKAGCEYTQHQAAKAWAELREYLTIKQRRNLGIDWSHITADRSNLPREQLDATCEEIRQDWREKMSL